MVHEFLGIFPWQLSDGLDVRMTTCLRIQLAPSWHHRRPAGIFKIVFSENFHSPILVILFREYFMNVAAQELHQDSGKSVQIFEINLRKPSEILRKILFETL